MKKLIFTLSIFCFFTMTLTAQEVEEVQNSVIFKRTATWCSNCGSWGWSLFESLLEEPAQGGILIAAHHSGDLTSQAGGEITDHFGAFGQPRFYLNSVDQNASSSNWQAKSDDIKAQVESAYTGASPVANVGIHAFYDGVLGRLDVNIKNKFFQDATGKFNIGLYLIENDIVNFQSNQGNDAVHKKVMRESLTGNTFGELIFEGSITAGTEYDSFYSFPMADPNQGNFEVVGIIWNEDSNGNYTIVNASMVNEFDQMFSNVSEISSDLADMTIMPTISENSTKIEVILNQNFKNVELEIFNVLGQSIMILSNDNLMEGTHHFEVTKSDIGGVGQYYARMKIGNQIKTKSLIFN